MKQTAVRELLYMLDRALESDGGHSLLGNLKGLSAEDWDWRPPGGWRRIRDIVGHVGACKVMYENYAFGDASLQWGDPSFDRQSPREGEAGESPEWLVDWLRGTHESFKRRVADLSDEDLVTLRPTNRGEMWETRRIIAVIVEHDLYHAGEVNHIIALRRGSDRWEWE